MPRPRRVDYPGAWHHVSNRGVGQRSVFETRRELRSFLSRVARTVRDGLIEVHAFTLLLNHYHLLVRSLEGKLSCAVRVIQDGYAQKFNWRRDRRGPLWQGRFKSGLIQSAAYWENVVRYIDHNPVKAGETDDPLAYEFGSARHHAHGTWPPWLTREPVASTVRAAAATAIYSPRDYFLHFGGGLSASAEVHLLRGAAMSRGARVPLDDLVGASPEHLQQWLVERARIADGTRAGFLVLEKSVLPPIVDGARLDGKSARMMLIGLMRSLCALTFEEIAGAVGVSTPTAMRDARAHARRLIAEDEYRLSAARIVGESIRAEYREPVARVPFREF